MAPTQAAFQSFTLALIQLATIETDKAKNLEVARNKICEAASGQSQEKKPDLIVLPEFFNTPLGDPSLIRTHAEEIGFTPGKPYDITTSKSDSVKMLSDVAKETGTWLIGGSLPERDGEKFYNTCTIYNPKGELVARHRKIHLFDIDIPGKITVRESDVNSGGDTITMFDTEFARIGVGICYDIRFPELAMVAARRGQPPDFIVCWTCAFSMTTGELHWELLQRLRAVDNQVFMGMCSCARDANTKFKAWGHSMVVDPLGRVLGEAGEAGETLYVAIAAGELERGRREIPVGRQRRWDVYRDVADAE